MKSGQIQISLYVIFFTYLLYENRDITGDWTFHADLLSSITRQPDVTVENCGLLISLGAPFNISICLLGIHARQLLVYAVTGLNLNSAEHTLLFLF